MEYTSNYHLPQWVETDRIMMGDFNQMCSDIETGLVSNAQAAAAAQAAAEAVQDAYTPDNKPYVVGSYTGDGTTNNRAINLGFKPRFLIITGMSRSSNEDDSPLKRFALVGPGGSSSIASLTETGFTVINSGSRYPDLNSNWSSYSYIAFR